MGVFGLTMAVPFVLLSLLPGRIQAMPKSGQWMNTLKFFLGFVEVARVEDRFRVDDVIVTDVEFESQATEKGIGRDMVITSMNNRPVESVSDFADTMDGLEPGEVIKLDVLAGRREFTVFLRKPE